MPRESGHEHSPWPSWPPFPPEVPIPRPAPQLCQGHHAPALVYAGCPGLPGGLEHNANSLRLGEGPHRVRAGLCPEGTCSGQKEPGPGVGEYLPPG